MLGTFVDEMTEQSFDPETGLRRPHIFRTLFIYLIGVMFLLLAAKLALRSSVFGFGLWADYLLSDAEDHNPLSTPRLLGWVISSISFFVASLNSCSSTHSCIQMPLHLVATIPPKSSVPLSDLFLVSHTSVCWPHLPHITL